MRRLLALLLGFVLIVPSSAVAGTAKAPEAADECGMDEVTDTSDLTAPDAPWTDLCAIWLGASVANNRVSSLSVTWKVAGMVGSRPPTGTWTADLVQGPCRHELRVTDTGGGGTAGATLASMCNATTTKCDEPFRTIYGTLEKIPGEWLCGGGTKWGKVDWAEIPASAVRFGADTIALTIKSAQMTPLMRSRVVPGARITRVSGNAGMIVKFFMPNSSEQMLTGEPDVAASTGRQFVVR